MKKLIASLLSLTMVMSLAACGSYEEDDSNGNAGDASDIVTSSSDDTSTTTTTTTTTTPEPEVTVPTETTTEEIVSEPDEEIPDELVDYNMKDYPQAADLAYTIEDGVLTITGNGAIPQYWPDFGEDGTTTTNAPWFGDEDFADIHTIVIGEGITLVTHSFTGAENVERIVLSSTVETIDSYAFSNFIKLKEITIPSTVKCIREQAFWNSGLEKITIEEGVEIIGNGVFMGTYLTSIDIPASVRLLEGMPFEYANELVEVNVAQSNEYYTSVDGSVYTKDMKTLVYCPYVAEGEEFVVPEGVEELGYKAFGRTADIDVTISLPSTLTTIGGGAFSNTSSRNKIVISEDNKNLIVGEKAIYSADMETLVAALVPYSGVENTIKVPDGVKHIGDGAFEGFTCYEQIVLPEGLESVGKHAFAGCPFVGEIKIPDSVTYIDEEALVYGDETVLIYKGNTYDCYSLYQLG